ncbi:MAG: hypothetical protein ACRELV_06275, partial [Longimicrobiales bacterium]
PRLERVPGAPTAGAVVPARTPDRSQFALFVAAPARYEGDEAGEHDGAGAGGAPVEPVPQPQLWQVHDTYIFAETRSGLIIIDQHSAHERILFEELMRGFDGDGVASQRLLFPITLRLAPAEYAIFEQGRPLFARAGYEIEPFGGRTVIVHAVPDPHPWFDAERCLREMVGELAEGSDLTRAATTQHERIASTFACKAAIKAGQPLTRDAMAELFDRLFETELPYHDVHGRPTVVRLSLQELQRRFGRGG